MGEYSQYSLHTCAVHGCKSRKSGKNKVPTHAFPKKESIGIEWVKFCKNSILSSLEYREILLKQFFICHKHFDPKYYYKTGRGYRLMGDIVPSIYLPVLEEVNTEQREDSFFVLNVSDVSDANAAAFGENQQLGEVCSGEMEICIDSFESAVNAIKGGASRLEVCSALSEGGLTPSPGLLSQIRKISPIPIYAMIRVKTGNFVYSREEMDAMLFDVEILKNLGSDGFVFGALTEDNEVHGKFCQEILDAAQPRPVTFHRAFDEVADPLKSLETLCEIGFERILTSGQKETAHAGIALIQLLVEKAQERIIIMPGAGITKDNLRDIKKISKAREFHASAKKIKIFLKRSNDVRINNTVEFSINVTDQYLVREMVNIVKEDR